MSNRNNDVFAVLPTSNNVALLTAGNTEDDLAIGQLGCFDANSGLSVVTLAAVRDFYFALGVDKSGGGVLDDIRKSAGQFTQRQGVVSISYKAHSAGRPKIVVVGGYTAKCDTDYAVKVEHRNSRIYRMQGFNQFADSYNVRTGCCVDCGSDCDIIDANILTNLLVAEINRDEKNLLIAQPVARQAIDNAVVTTLAADYAVGAVVSAGDMALIIAYNATQTDEADKFFTDLQITSVPLTLAPQGGDVNLGFHKFVETEIIVSISDGFTCSGTVTTLQTLAFAQGKGGSVRQMEYKSLAWCGTGPYAASDVTGVGFAVPYLADASGDYDQFILEYNQKSESGWLEYSNPLSTIFAIPATHTTTRNSLATVLATIPNFETLVDDAAAASVDPEVVEGVPADSTKDGLA